MEGFGTTDVMKMLIPELDEEIDKFLEKRQEVIDKSAGKTTPSPLFNFKLCCPFQKLKSPPV